MPASTQVLFVVAVGLVAGSFLNVVIERLPRGKELVRSRSRCPQCGRTLTAWELIPIVSWLVLRGRCYGCRRPISPRYPLVELGTGLLWWLCYAHFGWTRPLIPAVLLVSVLIAVAVIDLYRQRIPNALNLAGLVLVVPPAWLAGLTDWRQGLLGGAVLGGILLLVAVLSKGGVGGGDIKLASWLGLVLGWQGGFVMLLLAVFAAAAVGLVLMLLGRRSRRDMIAFGPFLALGAIVALFWGEAIIRWYLRGPVG